MKKSRLVVAWDNKLGDSIQKGHERTFWSTENILKNFNDRASRGGASLTQTGVPLERIPSEQPGPQAPPISQMKKLRWRV